MVLEEGQRDRWFESNLIVWLTVVMVVGFICLAIAQVTAKKASGHQSCGQHLGLGQTATASR